MALRHKSVASEINKGIKDSNERLEFLGDSIINAVITEYLFKKFPFKEEGFLTQFRSKIVSRENLNKLSEKLGIVKFLNFHKESTNSYHNSLGGNAFEALIGAVFLDKGYLGTKKIIVNRILKYHIDLEELETKEVNFKSRLIEWVQKEKKNIDFILNEEKGNSNKKNFYINVVIDGEIKGKGASYSKKKAEQIASEEAYKSIIEKNVS